MPIDPDTIILVETSKNDFNDFRDLRKSVMKPTVIAQGLPWDEEAENIYHQKLFDAPGLLKIMAGDAGDERIGYIGVYENEDHDIELSRFCITDEHQGNGLGSYILSERVFPIPEFQGKDFVLEVLKANPAQNLYESLGFAIEKEDDKLFYYRRTAKN